MSRLSHPGPCSGCLLIFPSVCGSPFGFSFLLFGTGGSFIGVQPFSVLATVETAAFRRGSWGIGTCLVWPGGASCVVQLCFLLLPAYRVWGCAVVDPVPLVPCF